MHLLEFFHVSYGGGASAPGTFDQGPLVSSFQAPDMATPPGSGVRRAKPHVGHASLLGRLTRGFGSSAVYGSGFRVREKPRAAWIRVQELHFMVGCWVAIPGILGARKSPYAGMTRNPKQASGSVPAFTIATSPSCSGDGALQYMSEALNFSL